MRIVSIVGVVGSFLWLWTSCGDSSDSSVTYSSVSLQNETEREWTEGWLHVPENRKRKNSDLIRIPFIYTRDTTLVQPSFSPVLVMSGGPGNGSLHMANGMTRSVWGAHRDILVMDQRGTGFCEPSLRCPEISEALDLGYSLGLCREEIDSLYWLGVRDCYDRLMSDQIDLSGYHTLESVEDMEELRRLLDIPKWTLYGMSYSCNLMTAYAQLYPNRVEALILDSPLPHEVQYDEEAPLTMDSLLKRTLNYYKAPEDTYDRFTQKIMSLDGRTFQLNRDSTTICYTSAALIDLVINAMSDHSSLAEVPAIVESIIQGDPTGIEGMLLNRSGRTWQSKGMRYSLWIAEELSEQSQSRIEKAYREVSWLNHYPLNDISFKTTDKWSVQSMYEEWSWPDGKYDGPALILSGELDPWTPDWYGKIMIKTVPNAQHKIYPEKSHVPGFTTKGMEDIHHFLQSM